MLPPEALALERLLIRRKELAGVRLNVEVSTAGAVLCCAPVERQQSQKMSHPLLEPAMRDDTWCPLASEAHESISKPGQHVQNHSGIDALDRGVRDPLRHAFAPDDGLAVGSPERERALNPLLVEVQVRGRRCAKGLPDTRKLLEYNDQVSPHINWPSVLSEATHAEYDLPRLSK